MDFAAKSNFSPVMDRDGHFGLRCLGTRYSGDLDDAHGFQLAINDLADVDGGFTPFLSVDYTRRRCG